MSKKFRHLRIFQDDGEARLEDIERFEKSHNICFPPTYKELMLKHNGAYLKECEFDFINKAGEEDTRAFSFESFGEKERGKELITESQFVSKPDYYGVPGLISIGSTAEGDAICFDYRDDPKTCEPKVIVLVHDDYEETDGYKHRKIEPIADSFDAFLDMLYEYVDEEDY
jgi:cell wall assembly regulator SMI1